MWVEALWFVSRHGEVPVDVISDLLKHIDEQSILPPLMVLEILSHSQTVTLGVVKVCPYFSMFICSCLFLPTVTFVYTHAWGPVKIIYISEIPVKLKSL